MTARCVALAECNVNTDSFHALVKPQTGDDLPGGYAIRLVGERESLTVPMGGSVECNIWFSSLEPLHLYNLVQHGASKPTVVTIDDGR